MTDKDFCNFRWVSRAATGLVVSATSLASACGSQEQSPTPVPPNLDAASEQAASDAVLADLLDEKSDSRPLLDVLIRGVGGRVVSKPAGIDCSSSCSAHFDPGTTVVLTANASPSYWFGGWLKDCQGVDSCELKMTTPHAVSASFFLDQPPWDSSVGGSDCQAAWQSQKFSPCDKTPDDYAVVNKTKRNLALCNNGVLSSNFRLGLGFSPSGDKEKEGDGKTPEGVFYISARLPNSDYHRALLLSYPDKADAERGLAAGLIDDSQKAAIDAAQDSCGEPPSDSGLGGEIEIHGGTGSTDWTAGCVAVEDNQMDTLWTVLEQGDTVVVVP